MSQARCDELMTKIGKKDQAALDELRAICDADPN